MKKAIPKIPEIEAKVYARFPVLPTERKCATEHSTRQMARRSYRIKLLNELTAANIEQTKKD